MRRLEAGAVLQQRLVGLGFTIDDGVLGPGTRESRSGPGRNVDDIWDVVVEWAQQDVDLGPHAIQDDDLLLFEAFVDLAPPAKYREDRPAFVLSFKRQLEFREEAEGPVVAESLVRLELTYDVAVAPIDLAAASHKSFSSIESFWYGGGSTDQDGERKSKRHPAFEQPKGRPSALAPSGVMTRNSSESSPRSAVLTSRSKTLLSDARAAAFTERRRAPPLARTLRQRSRQLEDRGGTAVQATAH